MKIRRFAPLVAVLAIVAATSRPAAGAGFICPDGFVPVPAIFVIDAPDKNGNGFVCVKGPQGENGHFNSRDDKVVDDIFVP